MINNEFSKTKLQQIREVLAFASNNDLSDFYRRKFKKVYNIKSYDDFLKIPLLSKTEIVDTKVNNRIFVENNSDLFFTFTSGTTKLPLVMPQNGKSLLRSKYILMENDAKSVGSERILNLFPASSSPFYKLIAMQKRVTIVPGDVSKLGQTAELSKIVGIDGIITTPTILTFFLEELAKCKFDMNTIKFIALSGEYCTKSRHSYFKTYFSNALITYRYANSEVGGPVGYKCTHLISESPDIFHPTDDGFLEVVDSDGKPTKEQGEIVYTDLEVPKAFPMIRYKTGDLGRIYKKDCPCGKDTILEVGGKNTHDRLKFSGVTLYTEAIENALLGLEKLVKPFYQLIVSEIKLHDKLFYQLELEVSTPDKSLATDNNKRVISKHFSEKLYLAQDKNLKYFVDNGILLPLIVSFVDSRLEHSKTKTIVSNLQ